MAEQTTYQVLYWREIPAQIRVYANSRPKSYQLPERFQLKIDRIAMEEGLAAEGAALEQLKAALVNKGSKKDEDFIALKVAYQVA